MKKLIIFLVLFGLANSVLAWDDASEWWRKSIENKPWVAVISDITSISSLPLVIPYAIGYSFYSFINGELSEIPGIFIANLIIYPSISFPLAVVDICLLGFPLSKLKNDPMAEALLKPLCIHLLDKLGNFLETKRNDNKEESLNIIIDSTVGDHKTATNNHISSWNYRKSKDKSNLFLICFTKSISQVPVCKFVRV